MSKKHQRPPWGDMLGRKPIERLARLSDTEKLFDGEDKRVAFRKEIEEDAFAQQFARVRQIKEEHYGIEGTSGWRPWYELCVALIAELDDSVNIKDPPPPGKKSPIWHIQGKLLFDDVEFYWEEQRRSSKPGHRPTLESVLTELRQVSCLWREFGFATLKRQYLAERARREKGAKQ